MATSLEHLLSFELWFLGGGSGEGGEWKALTVREDEMVSGDDNGVLRHGEVVGVNQTHRLSCVHIWDLFLESLWVVNTAAGGANG